jgi:MFS family permease
MFTKIERTATFSLSAILAFRMLGLFIIIPVFSPYLQTLSDATPLLIGLTVGVYGLTQALLQIPFGILSDYIGRREVITMGLVLFLLGSIVAGSTDSIYGVLLGRALQGAGAISGTIIALLSDLTGEESRTKAMAIIGMSIGAAFTFAFMCGPILNSIMSVDKIFYLVAALVIPVLFLLWCVVPYPQQRDKYDNDLNNISILYKDKNIFAQLALHSFGAFSLHGILMANFIALPILLRDLGLTSYSQGLAYIEVFFVAIILMLPLLFYSERKKQQTKVLILSVCFIFIAEIIFWLLFDTFWGIMLGLVIFFVGFNILEASLPSLISKVAHKQNRGAALGVYSTAQFLGPMLGGILSGVLFKFCGLVTLFILGILWSCVWLFLLLYAQNNMKILANKKDNLDISTIT